MCGDRLIKEDQGENEANKFGFVLDDDDITFFALWSAGHAISKITFDILKSIINGQ